jgi:hypothetical protein
MRHFFFLGCMAFALPAPAAEIIRTVGSNGVDIVSVRGTFNDGDDRVFKKLAAEIDQAVVVLDSGGGDLHSGLEIGRAIRLRAFATAVPPDSLCASACALTWLAGSPRLLAPTSKLGFHAAYRVVDGTASESGSGNALVGAYLNQLGIGDKAVVYVTSAPPEGIEWLTADKAGNVGISFESIEATAPDLNAEGRPKPHDPMSTTTAFYSALAAADGEAAAALVVPEKRGKGPFNETSIRSFFGAMSVPLRLTGTTMRARDDVRVSYEYTTDKGRRCRGRADVETVYLYGRTLISRIKALEGC